MEKFEIRAVIKYFFLKGLTATDIKKELDSTLGDSSPSNTTVKRWVAEFKIGRKSTNDEPRSGRPIEVTTAEMTEKVRKIVLTDRRVKVREIAETVSISTERVRNILHEHLTMKKLCSRWVPRLLTPVQKQCRKDISTDCLALYKSNPTEFLRRFITVDETWVHHYTPETKQQSKQWTVKGEPAPKKAKTVASASKFMSTVFWYARVIIFIDYLQKGKTITGVYYANLLEKLNEEIKRKRPHLAKKKVLFHQDNAPVHTSHIAMSKIHQLKFELLRHPPYSPDLAPCDFHLFPNLKKWLGGKRFANDNEVINAVNDYFADLDKSTYQSGITALEHRWNKCIELNGDYVEK
jgi:histone-lysine N-methyltransferase SETMAR